VVIGTTPSVQYAYDTAVVGNVFTRNHRLQQITNPSGRQTWFGYNEGTADSVQHRRSLIREIKKGSGGTQYTVYDHNGNGRLVIADYPAPDVKLDYFQGTTGTYACFNRFGRVKDQFWDGYSMTADVSRVKHGYDYAGNRLWREDVIASNNGKDHDEFYSYDGLHRLTKAERGNLNTGYTGLQTKNFGQEWKLDLVGNWDNGASAAFSQDNDGNGTWELQQTRDHNKANETTSIGAIAGDDWYDPTCATTGNLDTGPKPGAPKDNDANGRKFRYTWDAWNRMVKVEQSPTNASTWTEIAQYEYDGLNQRIVKTDKTSGTVTNDYYYNQEWQVLEVRRGGVAFPFEEFVWHPHYIDALAVRCYDLDVNGSQDEQYCAQDANFNVVAMLGTTGSVIERYQYAAYGSLTVLGEGSDTFAPDLGNLTDIENSCGYTGRELDRETGLCYYRNRNYDCGLGRFVSRDPIVYEGSRSNLYGYVESDPTGSLDPLGLQWHHWFPGGNELWTQISRICRHTPFDRDDYTTWVTGSTGVRGTEHYWIHHDWNYNGRVQNLIDQSNRDCCWLTRRMVDLIWDTWNNMGHQTDDMIIRKYPTRYPNSPELDPGPLFDDLINRNCSGPTPGRRPELPIGPKPELPWWVPSRVEDDWRQNVKILIGAEVIGVPLILGGGAILGGAGAGAGVGRVVVSVGAAS
jgi:RHS repeat-associated protein